jgi:RNA polymerase sigma factor (sigma-70 family)
MSTDLPFESFDPGPTREELFLRLQNPDEADDARNEILAMYYSFMYSATRRVAIPRHYQEQVVSDVVESLARYLKRFRYNRKAGRFRDYVKRCLKNAYHKRENFDRRQARSGYDPEFFDAAAPLDSLLDHTLEDEMRHDEVSRAYQQALAGFNPTYQGVMQAFIAGGRDVREIAEAHEVSVQNVYKIVSRVRERVRENLDQMDDWPSEGSSDSGEDS